MRRRVLMLTISSILLLTMAQRFECSVSDARTPSIATETSDLNSKVASYVTRTVEEVTAETGSKVRASSEHGSSSKGIVNDSRVKREEKDYTLEPITEDSPESDSSNTEEEDSRLLDDEENGGSEDVDQRQDRTLYSWYHQPVAKRRTWTSSESQPKRDFIKVPVFPGK